MERHRVLRALHVDAERVVVARHVQRPDVQADDAGDHERQQVVQREEAVQRRRRRPRSRPTARSRCAEPRCGDDLVERGEELVITVAPQKHIWPQGST